MMTNRSMPSSTVVPVVPYPDIGAAITWLCDTFGFTMRLRIANRRAQLNIGDGALILTEQRPTDQRAGSVIMVRLDNVDEHHQHASQRGARVISPPASYPYGERQYTVEDLAGHHWTFSQSLADVDPREWGGTPGTI
jgi:uncharacterized glyoxalase superfamily protein PhnB